MCSWFYQHNQLGDGVLITMIVRWLYWLFSTVFHRFRRQVPYGTFLQSCVDSLSPRTMHLLLCSTIIQPKRRKHQRPPKRYLTLTHSHVHDTTKGPILSATECMLSCRYSSPRCKQCSQTAPYNLLSNRWHSIIQNTAVYFTTRVCAL